jgi:hypothetical protein
MTVSGAGLVARRSNQSTALWSKMVKLRESALPGLRCCAIAAYE